jgi:hypothetical protein
VSTDQVLTGIALIVVLGLAAILVIAPAGPPSRAAGLLPGAPG